LLYGEFRRHLSSDKGIDARSTELGGKKRNSQDTYFVAHEVYEIFHSVIFLKLKESAITFFVSSIFVVKVQINFIYKIHLYLYGGCLVLWQETYSACV
jgi:hypothetical protein